MLTEAGLSLGSNLGDRLHHLQAARDAIAALPGVTLLAQSAVYETEPVGVKDVYRSLSFLNAVLAVEITIPSETLAAHAHAIEAQLERVRTEDRYAPRPIDIDVLYVGNEVSDCTALTLPHPRWAERRFVVQPLADVRPDLVLPGLQHAVKDVLLALPSTPEVLLYRSEW